MCVCVCVCCVCARSRACVCERDTERVRENGYKCKWRLTVKIVRCWTKLQLCTLHLNSLGSLASVALGAFFVRAAPFCPRFCQHQVTVHGFTNLSALSCNRCCSLGSKTEAGLWRGNTDGAHAASRCPDGRPVLYSQQST